MKSLTYEEREQKVLATMQRQRSPQAKVKIALLFFANRKNWGIGEIFYNGYGQAVAKAAVKAMNQL